PGSSRVSRTERGLVDFDEVEQQVDERAGEAGLFIAGQGAAELRVDADGLGDGAAGGLDAVEGTGGWVPGEEARADVDGAGFEDGAVLAERDLGGATADIDVEDCFALAGAGDGAGAVRGQDRLEARAGGGAHE